MKKIFTVLLLIFAIAGLTVLGIKRKKGLDRDKYFSCLTRLTECGKRLGLTKAISGHYPKSLVGEDFPQVGCDGAPIGYELSSDGEDWLVYCKGNHHSALGLQADQPAYSSQEGPIHTLEVKHDGR